MKKNCLFTILLLVVAVIVTSCGTLTGKTRRNVTFVTEDDVDYATLVIDDKEYKNVSFPFKTKIKCGFSPTSVIAKAEGYEPYSLTINKKVAAGTLFCNLITSGVIGLGVDLASGALTKPEMKQYFLSFKDNDYTKDPTIAAGEANNMVSRDNPGATELERTILRWYFDSDPRGARISYRVISNIPSQVKNTNETYLTTTPLEETRSFNILGLTYENSRDVQIEIKVSKRGYEDQIKRYNVRQAIDQQEISGFFELVPKEN